MSNRSIKDFFIQDENSGSNDEDGKVLDRIAWQCSQTSTQKYTFALSKLVKSHFDEIGT